MACNVTLRGAVMLSLAGAAGCTHAPPSSRDSVPSVSELGVVDPDPDSDGAGPAFCNPTSKQGDELKKCYQHNDELYKVFEDEAKKREPWFNFAGESWLQSKELDQKYVSTVLKDEDAVKRLESTPVVELTPAEAKAFTGKALSYPGLKPYLVRGLMYLKDNGSFSVFEKDQAIFVRHDSIGSTTPSERRTGVVVYLPFKPKEVFVDCQIAE